MPRTSATVAREVLATTLTLAVVIATSSPSHAATWSLVGGSPANPRPVLAVPHRGQALLCRPDGCEIFDLATGAWRSTPSLALAWNSFSYRLSDGNVVVIQTNPVASVQIRDAKTGLWRTAATLPDVTSEPALEQLDDGRVLLSVFNSQSAVVRTYFASEQLDRWTRGPDGPDLRGVSWRMLSATTVAVFDDAPTKFWRYRAKLDRWTQIAPGERASGPDTVSAWGADVVVLARHDTTWRAVVVNAAGTTTASTSFSLDPHLDLLVAAPPPGDAPAAAALIVSESNGPRALLWRRGAAPVPLPPDPMGLPYELAALDDEHFIGLGPRGTVQLLSLDDKPAGGKPCDGLVAYLQRTPEPPPSPYAPSDPVYFGAQREEYLERELAARNPAGPSAYAALVSPACRETVGRGDAASLLALLHDWSRGSDERLRTKGRVLACASHDPTALSELPALLADTRNDEAHAICTSELATWAGAEKMWDPSFAKTVRKTKEGWEVDDGVVAAAVARGGPELREHLVPALRTAEKRRARGYDRLRAAVCFEDGAVSGARKQACATLPATAEDEWKTHGDKTNKIISAVAITAVAAGAIAGAYVGRNSDASLAIATGSGCLTGAALGIGIGALASLPGSYSRNSNNDAVGGIMLLGGIGGAVLGGLAAHALAASPSRRAPVTAGGLVIPYLVTMVIVFD